MRNAIGILVVLLSISFPQLALSQKCLVRGEISAIELGEHVLDNQVMGLANYRVKFTELTVELYEVKVGESAVKSKRCKDYAQKKRINVGLCEEQTLLIGDVIEAQTGAWLGGPECVHNVRILKRRVLPK